MKGNNSTTELVLPLMVPDLEHKFQMICRNQSRTYRKDIDISKTYCPRSLEIQAKQNQVINIINLKVSLKKIVLLVVLTWGRRSSKECKGYKVRRRSSGGYSSWWYRWHHHVWWRPIQIEKVVVIDDLFWWCWQRCKILDR